MSLLTNPRLKLIEARKKILLRNTFDWDVHPWQGDINSMQWHMMSVDTNVDTSAGLDGNLALNTAGCYLSGKLEREVELKNYGEIVFECYVQNLKPQNGSNYLRFYIDDVLKLEYKDATPWHRIEPLGISVGKHKLRFEYVVDGVPDGKKGVFDTFTIYEGADIDCLVTKYEGAKPAKGNAISKTLRGFSRVQEMVESDTEIKFTIMLDALQYEEFIVKHNNIFYFVDEFGKVYRGSFISEFNPEPKVLASLYYISVTMLCNQRLGIGFC